VRPAQEEKEEEKRRTPLLDQTVSQVRSLMLQFAGRASGWLISARDQTGCM
jgi:hypothetical protein